MAWMNNYTMPMFSKTLGGKERFPPLPLSFDRLNEGRTRSAASLFRLPGEILDAILSHVASDSLASLALVNSDCLIWARSRQFVSVELQYKRS